MKAALLGCVSLWLGTALVALANGPLLLDAQRLGNTIIAVGENGLILQRATADANWSRVESGVKTTLTGLSFANDTVGWAVGHAGIILQTADGGATWTAAKLRRARKDSFLDVLALSPDHAITVGSSGSYRETRDGGQTWKARQVIETEAHLNRIGRIGETTLFIAGDSGLLLRSNNEGETWQRVETGIDTPLYGVLGLRDGTLLAHGLHGRVLRSTDDGATWAEVPTGARVALFSGVELRDGRVLLAGQGQLCLSSGDGGQSFAIVPHDVSAIATLLLDDGSELLTFGDAGVFALALANP